MIFYLYGSFLLERLRQGIKIILFGAVKENILGLSVSFGGVNSQSTNPNEAKKSYICISKPAL